MAFLRKPVRDAYYRNDSLEHAAILASIAVRAQSITPEKKEAEKANVGGMGAYMKCGRIFENFRGCGGII